MLEIYTSPKQTKITDVEGRWAQKSIIAKELLATDNFLEKMHLFSLRVWPLINRPHYTRTSRPGEVLIALDGLKHPIESAVERKEW